MTTENSNVNLGSVEFIGWPGRPLPGASKSPPGRCEIYYYYYIIILLSNGLEVSFPSFHPPRSFRNLIRKKMS